MATMSALGAEQLCLAGSEAEKELPEGGVVEENHVEMCIEDELGRTVVR